MNDSQIQTAIAARQMAQDHSGTQTVLMNAASAAIQTAVTAGSFTCTLSLSGATSKNVSYLLESLHQLLYTTSVSGSTLTISW